MVLAMMGMVKMTLLTLLLPKRLVGSGSRGRSQLWIPTQTRIQTHHIHARRDTRRIPLVGTERWRGWTCSLSRDQLQSAQPSSLCSHRSCISLHSYL